MNLWLIVKYKSWKISFETTLDDKISIPTEKKSAFLIPEFERFFIDLSIGNKTDTIEISGGVREIIEKEEWRDEIVGNLFYPSKFGKFKPIIHLNGSVQLLQDARSQILARQGYTVLELGYNLPVYNQV